jgi:hypothetical protein
VIAVAIGVARAGSEEDDQPTSSRRPSADLDDVESGGETTPVYEPGYSGDGTYIIGQTIEPGLYVSTNNNNLCYWERATDASGDFDSILDNDNVAGQALVELTNPGEVFKTTRCTRWVPYVDPPGPLPFLGDGTWKVPGQVAPGRWSSSGGELCYWERSSGFDAGIGSILANDNTNGPTIVDIGPDDVAFKSNRCGTWTRAG